LPPGLNPLTKHLLEQRDQSAFKTFASYYYKKITGLVSQQPPFLSIGGFMMMPFGSAFAINNLKVTQHQLPIRFMVSGLSTLVIMPLIGKMSDRIDKFTIFAMASA
jgi:hypothetical protein